MIHLLPVDRPDQIPKIQWPDEVAVSEKVDWKKKLMEAGQADADEDGQDEVDVDDELYHDGEDEEIDDEDVDDEDDMHQEL